MNLEALRSKGLSFIVWFFLWLGFSLLIVAVGAAAGGVLFPIGGWIFGYELAVRQMVRNGIFDGGFYALIWGPGISFVLCVMLIRRKLSKIQNKES